MVLKTVKKEAFFEGCVKTTAPVNSTFMKLYTALQEVNNEIKYCSNQAKKWQEVKKEIKEQFDKLAV